MIKTVIDWSIISMNVLENKFTDEFEVRSSFDFDNHGLSIKEAQQGAKESKIGTLTCLQSFSDEFLVDIKEWF